MGVNRYTRRWFDVFESTQRFTDHQVAFLVRQLPVPPYRRILDVCCGRGRHAIPLARRGYEVVGIDRDEGAIRDARERSADLDDSAVAFVVDDVRTVAALDTTFDAVIVMWQSFGFFDEMQNRTLLADIAGLLSPNGRVVMDIYNRSWWRRNTGTTTAERAGRRVTTTTELTGDRLRVVLSYAGEATTDEFDWQLFSSGELRRMAADVGLSTVLVCTGFDEHAYVTDDDAVMQIVLERIG